MQKAECGFETSSELALYGPTISVEIGIDPKDPSGKRFHALVDTGAAESCIDRQVASDLKLPVVDRVEVSGVSGRHRTTMHIAYIHVPALDCTILGRFAAVDLIGGGQIHHALLGRTFLENFTMTYSGLTGSVELTT